MSALYAILDFSGTMAVVDEKRALQRCSRATGLEMEALMELTFRPDPTKFDQATMAACENIIIDEIRQARPIIGVKKAIRALKQRNYTIVISSNGSAEAIDRWLLENRLSQYLYLVFGREDGSKDKHFEQLARIEEIDHWLYVADSPKDFLPLEKWTGVTQVAVSARPGDIYPGRVKVFDGPFSAEIVHLVAIGG